MPYYFAPYVGNGSDQNPFRPRGSEGQRFSAIDLRDDLGAGTGNFNACLLWLPVAVIDPQLRKLAETADEIISQAMCDQINNFCGTSVVPAPFSDVVADLLLNPPPLKWNKLQPTRGRNVIWLNGKIHDSPAVINGGAEMGDNFNRPDAPDAGASWRGYPDNRRGSIGNNRSHGTDLANQMEAGFLPFQPGADCFAQCDIATWTPSVGAGQVGVMVRGIAPGGTREFYSHLAEKDASVSNDGGSLGKRVAGAFTFLDTYSFAADTWVTGDKIGIQAIGSSISGPRWRAAGTAWETWLGPVTDTSITAAGYAGHRVIDDVDLANTEGDNFLCGDGPLRRKFFIVPGGGAAPDTNMIVDGFDRVENPLTDISPITGLARWSLTSTQPIFPDDDVNNSFEIRADGAACRHPQFNLPKGCYRLDYQYGAEVQVGYVIVALTPSTSGTYGAVLRISNPGTNSITGYYCECRIRDHGGASDDEWRLFRIDAGSPYTRTQIGSSVFGPNLEIAGVIAFQALKDKIQGWYRPSGSLVWSKIAEATDATYSGLGYAGFYLNGTGQEGGTDPNTGQPVDQAQIDECFIGWRKFILSH